MQIKDIQKIACIGSGIIGASWATYFLWKGLEVVIHDISNEGLEQAKDLIASNLDFLVQKEIISEYDYQQAGKKSVYTTDIKEALRGAHFVQESAFEDYKVKQDIIENVDKYAPEAIYASSTSGLLISKIQEFSEHPERCIVAHPFNPPHLIPLVEIVKGDKTSDETVSLTNDFFQSIDKEPIIIHKEVPGHAANRMQAALWREAADLVQNGVCSVKDVDAAVRYGPGLRWALMGPHLTWDLASSEGIRGQLKHLGPSIHSWLDDMAVWKRFPENIDETLAEGVKAEKEHISADEWKDWRDDKLTAILKEIGKL